MNFKNYSDSWRDQILEMKKPATRITMESHIRILNSIIGGRPLSGLDEKMAQLVVSELRKTRSPRTIKNIIGTMSLILGRAKKEGLLSEVPKPELPKLPFKEQPWFTVREMNKLIEEASAVTAGIYHLLAETGLRIGEVLGLHVGDIVGNQLFVKRSVFKGTEQEPKTPHAIRTLTLSNSLRMRLWPYLYTQTPETRLFNPAWFIPVKGGYHKFRRGNATALAGLGCPENVIAYRLGHAGKGITMGTYVKNHAGIDKDWAEKIGALFV